MGKKYKSSIKLKSEDDIKPFIASLGRPLLIDYRDMIEDYLTISRKRKDNKLAMLMLQLNISREIFTTENSIRNLVNVLNNPEKAKEYVPQIAKIDEEQIQYWKDELHNNKIILSALKAIGDGILWRVLNFNTSLLFNLSYIDYSGFYQLDTGRINELHSLGDEFYNAQKRSFVYNAITNAGRIADIISKNYDGNIEFLEIKSSLKTHGTDKKERIERQIKRLNDLENLANAGEGFIGNQKIRIKNIPGAPDLRLDAIKEMLIRSRTEGTVWGLIRPHLGIVINNFGKLDKNMDLIDLSHNELHEQLSKNKEDKLFMVGPLEHIIFSPIRVPYTIYPFEESLIADILLGKIIIEYVLNVSLLFREMSDLGWVVIESVLTQKDINPEKDPFCTITNGPWTIKVPPSVINRIIFEGMSVKCLLDSYKYLDEHDKKHPEIAHLQNYEDEYKLWS